MGLSTAVEVLRHSSGRVTLLSPPFVVTALNQSRVLVRR